MKTTTIIAVMAFSTLATAYAADVNWPGGSGDIASDTAWGGTAPGPGDRAMIYGTGNWSLTASKDITAGRLGLYAYGGPLTIAINLGGHSWVGACADDWDHRFVLNGSADHVLAATLQGAFSNFSCFNIGMKNEGGYGGSGFSNANVEFTGTGTSFMGQKDDTVIGMYGTNNTLVISEGSHFTSGRALVLGGSGYGCNTVRITGAGSIFTDRGTGDYTKIGQESSRNAVIVENGARFEQYTSGIIAIGNGSGAADNAMEVRGLDSSFFSESPVNVGFSGACGNRLRVTDRASFSISKKEFNIGSVGSTSNVVEVVDAGSAFRIGNYLSIGQGDDSSFNRFIVSGGARADLGRGFAIGTANGACSNVLEVLDGAVLNAQLDEPEISSWALYFSTGPQSADAAYNDATIVGNGIVVSNASLVVDSAENASELLVNYRGTGGYLKALDGAYIAPNQSFSLGCGGTNAAYGLIYAAGEGTVLTNLRYHLKVATGSSAGHDNTVWIDDGAMMYIQDDMKFGDDSVPSAINNCLKVTNGKFLNYSTKPLWLCNHSRLVWGGSRSEIRVCTLRSTGGLRMRFEFDEDGIAPCGPVYESYLLDAELHPTVDEIVVDATKYVRNSANAGRRSFTIFRSENNRTTRTSGGVDLSTQSAEVQASVNQAFRNIIRCVPEGIVEVEDVDMAKSKITVSVQPRTGFMFMVW